MIHDLLQRRLRIAKKNTAIIVVTVIIASFLIGSMATAVSSAENENPLNELWERLLGLEGEVATLKEESELLERVHELEIRLACGSLN